MTVRAICQEGRRGGGERSRKFAVESDIPPAHIRSRQLGKLSLEHRRLRK